MCHVLQSRCGSGRVGERGVGEVEVAGDGAEGVAGRVEQHVRATEQVGEARGKSTDEDAKPHRQAKRLESPASVTGATCGSTAITSNEDRNEQRFLLDQNGRQVWL